MSDAEFHELSIIPEMDTPTHLTETQLTDADNSICTPMIPQFNTYSNDMNANKTTQRTELSYSDPSKPVIPSIKVTDVHEAVGEQDNIYDEADTTVVEEQPELTEQSVAGAVMEDTTGNAFDSERSKVLHNLLEQLEIRRAQRTRYDISLLILVSLSFLIHHSSQLLQYCYCSSYCSSANIIIQAEV